MDGELCPTSNAQQLRVVRQLLWDVISLHLYPAERDEIRRALGNALLDENETLFAEAGALADILGDVQLNTGALLSRHQLCSNPQRSMVETEIRLLIDRLHASATTTPYGSTTVRERDPDSLLPRAGKRDKAVLEYVATVAQIAETGGRPPSSAGLPPRPPTSLSASSRPGTSSRPPTALSASASITLPSPLSRPGTASPTLLGSRPSTASSAASSAATRYTDAPSVVAGVAEKLSVATIEAVRDTLRAALADERAALLEDIEYLQGLLDAEADLQVRAAAPPPSLAELKDYSSRLAAVVANEEARVEHEVRVSAMFAAADQQQSRPGRLRGIVDASRRPTSAGSTSSLSPGAAAAAHAALAGRGSSSTSGAGVKVAASGGSGTQMLVVHGTDDDARPGQAAAALGPAGAPPGDLSASSVSVPGSVARGSPLAAVRRPGSGGSGSAAAGIAASGAASVAPPPPVLPLRPSGMLPAVRNASGHEPVQPSALHKPAAGTATAAAEGNGLLAPAASISSPSTSTSALTGRLRQGSPGRLRQPGAGPGSSGAGTASPGQGSSLLAAGAPAAGPGRTHSPSVPPHRDRSPSLALPGSPARSPATVGTAGPAAAAPTGPSGLRGTGHRSGSTGVAAAPGTAAVPGSGTSSPAAGSAPGLRPLLPRSGSVGATMTSAERRHAAGSAAAGTSTSTAAAAAAAGGSTAATSVGRTTSSRNGAAGSSLAAVAAAPAASSPGSAVAARLAGADKVGSAGSAEAPQPTAVQPRALLGNKQSVVEQLDAEVDAVKGGLAAILERYKIGRPPAPTGSSAGPAAGGGAAGGTAAGAQRAAAR